MVDSYNRKRLAGMVGFIKWLIQEYNEYKLTKISERSPKEQEALNIQNYSRCLEVGFTQEQLIALMNLMYGSGRKNQ